MGSFYSNMVVWHPDRREVLAALGSAEALVGPAGDRATAVFHDDDAGLLPHMVAQPLSETLGCRVLFCDVHDDDIFSCELWSDGALVASYAIPDPSEYFGFDADLAADFAEAADELGMPSTEVVDVGAVVEALGGPNPARVREVLSADYTFAGERHGDLLEALELPRYPAGWGRRYILQAGADYDGPELTATSTG